MKSWLAQGSSGRRVTLLPGTTFLHINGTLVDFTRIETVDKLSIQAFNGSIFEIIAVLLDVGIVNVFAFHAI